MAKRKYFRKIYKKKKGGFFPILKFLGKLFFLFFLTCFFSLLSIFLLYAKDLPRPEDFSEIEITQSVRIYDRTGKVLLYEMFEGERRKWVSLNEIPDYLKKAVIATEDANFYHHPGVDLKGIARAILVDLKLKKLSQGGSTITQQLVRITFLNLKKTLNRKTKEAILALELERNYSKDQILEWYLNQIPFGRNSCGVEAASEAYFGKSVKELSLAQTATLAALIRAPSYYSAKENFEKLMERKNYVLDRMVAEGYITKEQAEKAKKEKIEFVKRVFPIKAPHFVFLVRDYLIKKYGKEEVKTRGFKVYTTLDWETQKIAEKAVKEGAERNKKYGVYNASLVAMNPKTGEILALVGSADWYATSSFPKDCKEGVNCKFEPKFDVAVLGKRQPGSAFKPFVYAKAFEKGYTPDTILWDVKTNFGKVKNKPYIPYNYDKRFRGPVTLREALAQSLNVPSVKLLYLVGVKDAIELAKKMGITTLKEDDVQKYGLSLVLGGAEVRLLDMVSAYSVFANEGLKVNPTFILKIVDSKGNIVEKAEFTQRRIMEKQIARLINDILSDNEARAPLFGRHSFLYFENKKVAAKTGTTQDFRDAWTIGYTPSIVCGVWVGNNDHSPPKIYAPSVVKAGYIWRKFMEKAILKYPSEEFTMPEKIITSKPVLKGKILYPPHSILFYVQKDNPQGPPPSNPYKDPQFWRWEEGIKNWLKEKEKLE